MVSARPLRVLWVAAFLFVAICVEGQKVLRMSVTPDQVGYSLTLPDSVTAISIYSPQDLSGRQIWFHHQYHSLRTLGETETDGFVSQLFLSDSPLTRLEFWGKDTWPQVYVDCYRGGYGPEVREEVGRVLARAKARPTGCEEPPLVPQSVWRLGLKGPKPGPSATMVAHVVVHHSATSNSATDYLLAVRNIYLYHVNYNGWDDVGYNYLISADGILWAGRDGQGIMDGDNVKGAHFCGKNSGTMGVCLVGDFSSQSPSDTALGSLVALAAWKLEKEGLQPFGEMFHPTGAKDGFDLPTICGHRDGHLDGVFGGCQTLCPGHQTYALMDSLRNGVADKLIACGYAVGRAAGEHSGGGAGMLAIGVETAVWDMCGREVGGMEWLGEKPVGLPNGFYILTQCIGNHLVRVKYHWGTTN